MKLYIDHCSIADHQYPVGSWIIIKHVFRVYRVLYASYLYRAVYPQFSQFFFLLVNFDDWGRNCCWHCYSPPAPILYWGKQKQNMLTLRQIICSALYIWHRYRCIIIPWSLLYSRTTFTYPLFLFFFIIENTNFKYVF